jgi:hyperosmotically inducible periplasmic protein
MERQTRQLCAVIAGALFLMSGIALGQESTTPSSQRPSSQGSMRDSMQIQGGRQDTVQQAMPGDSLRGGVRDSSQGSTSGSVAPDNSGINKRDRNDNEMTADEQGQSAADIDMTRRIRQAIMRDDSLSTYAKNVKIITKDGMVTLKGPVRSEQEKTVIETKATGVAGTGKIKNQMEVKAATKSNNE